MQRGIFGPEYDEIADVIPDDHAAPSSAENMLAVWARQMVRPSAVLDLGCGDGRGVDVIRACLPDVRYDGVDIAQSPEVSSRSRDDAAFHSYDGVNLPFEDNSFDIVYSRQVFEHVRHPDRLAAQVWRVLKPGGIFVGSLAYLEPYHSYSIFNFTPYGVFRLGEDNQFRVRELRPGVEGLSLIVRQISARRIAGLSVTYPLIDLLARWRSLGFRERNYLKLRFAGHICFAMERVQD